MGATFFTLYDRPTGWYHLALNYFGSSQGQGITVYQNGEKIPTTGGKDRMPFVEANTAGEGSVAIGRFPIRGTGSYGSVEVDELRFFNQTLTNEAITMLSQLPSIPTE